MVNDLLDNARLTYRDVAANKRERYSLFIETLKHLSHEISIKNGTKLNKHFREDSTFNVFLKKSRIRVSAFQVHQD